MIKISIKKYYARFLASLLAAMIAICTLPLFFGTVPVEAAVLSSEAVVSEDDAMDAGYHLESSFRNEILTACAKMDGVKYEWGGGGWNGIDCAGSVSVAYSAALGTVWISGTSGSYGNMTLSYSGGGTPDKYGFYLPGYAGIKSSFTDGILSKRGIVPSEQYFSSFETNGSHGIQSDEWTTIITSYGFKPGDLILWWNDDNDSVNAQHITIYAGIENGVPMHWTASSSAGYFCKKPLADSSSEAGKGSFTGFMGLKATGLQDSAYVGFYLEKKDLSDFKYLGSVFSVYKDEVCSDKIGELRDDDSDGIYTDFYELNGDSYEKCKYQLTRNGNIYEDSLYIKETTSPSKIVFPDGYEYSLDSDLSKDNGIYDYSDHNCYLLDISLTNINGTSGKLSYSISTGSNKDFRTGEVSGYSYLSGSDAVVISNVAGNDGSDDIFTEACSISVNKTTSTNFDVSSTEFALTEGGTAVATYKNDGVTWNWYDINGTKLSYREFPVKFDTEYKVTEKFTEQPFECVDGSVIDYEYSNDSGWDKIDDTTYSRTFTTGSRIQPVNFYFSCENNQAVGKLKVMKRVTDTDDYRDGFVFELWNHDKTKKVAEGISDIDGIVYWKTGSIHRKMELTVPAGQYHLAEVLPSKYFNGTSGKYTYMIPEGFEDGGDGKWYKEITLDDYSGVLEDVTNDRSEVALEIVKEAEDGVIDNIEFELYYGGNGDEAVWEDMSLTGGRTDDDGHLVFENLPTGWYRIVENTGNLYQAVWDDGTEGNTRTLLLTEADDGKTVTVSACNKIDIKPVLATELTDKNTSHSVECGSSVLLTDKVHIENLVCGYGYCLTGCLYDKTTGELLTDENGVPYVEYVGFTADSSMGEVTLDEKGREVVSGDIYVSFDVNTAFLFESVFASGGDSLGLVCTETLEFNGIVIAEHSDLEDDMQTITVAPSISTTATDSLTGTGVMALSEVVDITDKVSFSGLSPNGKYIIRGVLMDKATGELYVDDEGKSYSTTVVFIPASSSGYALVMFDGVRVPMDMKELVVFESLSVDGSDRPIAVHNDLNDLDQTLRRPSCSTYAATIFGDKAFLKNAFVTVVDHVSYEGLEPGKTYYAQGSLYISNGDIVENGGEQVSSVTEFVPEESSGVVDVTFYFFSGSLSSGDRVVVTENIYDKSVDEEKLSGIQTEDILVLSHADLNNMDQSLSVTDLPISGEVISRDAIAGCVLLVLVTGTATMFVVMCIRKRKGKEM